MKAIAIEGVAEMSSGGGAVLDRGNWHGVVFLRPWYGPDGKIHRDNLRVLLPPSATAGLATRASRRVRDGSTLRLTVQMSPRRAGRLASAILRGTLRRVTPRAALARENAVLSERVTIRDALLGRLERASKSTYFVGRLPGSTRCKLVVWQEPDSTAEKTVAIASALVRRATVRLSAVPMLAAKSLLKLANQWRAAVDRPALSSAQLARRLRLTTISVPGSANELHLDFSCGDVFGEHGVEVTLTPSGRIRNAQMH